MDEPLALCQKHAQRAVNLKKIENIYRDVVGVFKGLPGLGLCLNSPRFLIKYRRSVQMAALRPPTVIPGCLLLNP